MPTQGMYGWPEQRGDEMRGFPGQSTARREPARFVQSKAGSAAASSHSVTLDAVPTQGHHLVVATANSSSTVTPTLSGGGVTTWTQVVARTQGTSVTVSIYVGKVTSTAPSATVTATYSGGGTTATHVAITEWTFPYDGNAGATGSSGGSQAGGGAAVRQSGDLVTRPDDVAFLCWYVTNSWSAASSNGWTYVVSPTSRFVFGYQYGLGATVTGTATDIGGSLTWAVVRCGVR